MYRELHASNMATTAGHGKQVIPLDLFYSDTACQIHAVGKSEVGNAVRGFKCCTVFKL